MNLFVAITLLLTGAGGASAAPGGDLATVLERLDIRAAALRSEVGQEETELANLSGKIADRKARRDDDALFADPILESALRRSRELSASLDELRRQLDDVNDRRAETRRHLLTFYNQQIATLRGQLNDPDPQVRARAATALQKILTARKAVRRDVTLASSPDPAVEDPTALSESDDPDELRARADELRDTRARLNRRLEAVRARLREARQTRALQAEMDTFLSERSLFVEQGRAVARLDGSTSTKRAGSDTGGTVFGGAGGSADRASNESVPTAGAFGVDDSADADGTQDPGSLTGGGGAPPPPTPTAEDSGTAAGRFGSAGGTGIDRVDRLATRDELAGDADALELADDLSVASLEEKAAELEALIEQLEAQANELSKKAEDAEYQR